LIEEIKEGGISYFMHKLGVGYTKYFNNKYKRVGSLCQGTFKAALIDNEKYLQYLLVYINVLNPGELVEPNLKENGIKNVEKIMQFAEEYQWSTQQEYLNKRNSIIIERGLLGEFFPNANEYREFVKNVLLDRKLDEISSLLLE